jgi:hypothetical protein
MEESSYRIRKNFLIPLGLVVLLTLILLICCLYLQLPQAKIMILTVFLLPTCLLFAESSLRRVSIGEDGILVNKLFRSKQLKYHELTSIDTVLVRKRAFVSLSTEEDFIILSNSYDHFGLLLKQLLGKAPEHVISDETRQLAVKPPEKSSDIFSAWLAVVVLLLILYVQLRGAF